MTYLQRFDRLYEIPKDRKTADYRQYLFDHLFSYLLDFLKRCKPLINIEKDLIHVRQEFELKWEQGIFPGWPVSSNIRLNDFHKRNSFLLERNRRSIGQKWSSSRS